MKSEVIQNLGVWLFLSGRSEIQTCVFLMPESAFVITVKYKKIIRMFKNLIAFPLSFLFSAVSIHNS